MHGAMKYGKFIIYEITIILLIGQLVELKSIMNGVYYILLLVDRY